MRIIEGVSLDTTMGFAIQKFLKKMNFGHYNTATIAQAVTSAMVYGLRSSELDSKNEYSLKLSKILGRKRYKEIQSY